MSKVIAVVVVWLGVTVAGFYWIENHLSQSGSLGEPQTKTRTDRWELVMAVHPKCPCTRASLHRLQELCARKSDAIAITILVWQPSGEQWTIPVEVPGAKVLIDTEGLLARKAGLETSGHAVLYRPDGTIAFSGGLTPGRGSERPGGGVAAVEALLNGKAAVSQLPVFGCSLYARAGTVQ